MWNSQTQAYLGQEVVRLRLPRGTKNYSNRRIVRRAQLLGEGALLGTKAGIITSEKYVQAKSYISFQGDIHARML